MRSRKTGLLQVTRAPQATLTATPCRKVHGSAHILSVAVALISVYIPNRVTQSVLLHPIRNNISASVQQLADVAKGMALPVDAEQVGIASLAAALCDICVCKLAWNRWSKCCARCTACLAVKALAAWESPSDAAHHHRTPSPMKKL
jgi:hypothetical protein